MLANDFRNARKSLGLTQRQLAIILSDPDGDVRPVHVTTIQHWEHGRLRVPGLVSAFLHKCMSTEMKFVCENCAIIAECELQRETLEEELEVVMERNKWAEQMRNGMGCI